MTERAARLAPLALLLVLAGALLLPFEADLAEGGSGSADEVARLLDDVGPGSSVLVGFDPDVGTYAEIRPTVRTLLAEVMERGATATVLSLTPEGRALAIAELERARRLSDGVAIVDRGYLPGAEAALVRVADAIEAPASVVEPDGMELDLDRPDLLVVVGGNDLGPRSWVEQVLTRIDPVPAIAVTPTVLLPEVEPYRDSGQLAAVIGTPREGATYRGGTDLRASGTIGDRDGGPSGLAVIVGMVVAVGWLGAVLARRLGTALPPWPDRRP